MEFGFWDVMQILGSLAFFIYGMKLMSDGIQRAAGAQLRNILRTMTKNRFLGVFTGFLITALLQSSSATTVMAVSFVNAGLLSLVESAGVLMGANIGTTITGWIVSILGFKVKLNVISIPLFAIGFPMTFMERGKIKYWGEFILGFSILFMGLGFLKDSVPDLKGSPEALLFLQNFTNWGILSTIFFVFVGTVITVIVQSSSAAMAITLTMCAQGWLPFEVAAAMILGENIGTTITANIAAMVGNREAKRAARIHTLFNVSGVVWMVLAMPFFLEGLMDFIQSFIRFFQDNFGWWMSVQSSFDPFNNPGDMTIGLSAFHTAFNIINVILLIGFTPFLVKIAKLWVPASEDDDDATGLTFIKSPALTPELATIELQREAAHFGGIVVKMSGFMRSLINTTDSKEQKKYLEKIKKYEEITDRIEVEITDYITNLSNRKITPKTSLRLRSVLNIANDLERAGDIFYSISKAIEKKIKNKDYFLPEQRNNINKMIDALDNALKIMLKNLNTENYDSVEIEDALEAEKSINKLRKKLRKENLKRVGDVDYNAKTAMIYNNVFSTLEKIGDHILNVTESIVGEI